jgi:predicted  nucleic acid-binding Zn-ribbon protein
VKYYQDTISLEYIEELLKDMEFECDHAHDDCYSAECVTDMIDERTAEEREEIRKLEDKISDLEADMAVYKKRKVSKKLADNFMFSPEEARKQFRLVQNA